MLRKIKQMVNFIKSPKLIPISEIKNENEILKNKVAVISGGSGGIGKAIAKEFINSGCKVIITGTNELKLKQLKEKFGNNCKYYIINLKEINKFDESVTKMSEFFGKIDILVNASGVHTERNNLSFLNFSEEEYNEVMDINLRGTYFLTQAVSKYFIKNKIKGHILCISSSTALEPAWSPYRLSKWGTKGFVLGIAKELLPYNITVNAIAPGSTATAMLKYKEGESIYTDQNTNGRYVMPEEVAFYSKYLVSDMGDMIVGDTIYISGGRGIIDVR